MGYWVYLLRCGGRVAVYRLYQRPGPQAPGPPERPGSQVHPQPPAVELVYREEAADRSAALRREAAIKRLTRAEKAGPWRPPVRPDLPPAPREK